MGFSSQSGQMIIAAQPTPLVVAPTLGTTGLAVRIRSGTLAPSRDLLIPDPEIGSGRDITDAYLGAVSYAGDYEMYCRGQAAALYLKAVLGSASSVVVGTATATVGTHTITPVDGQVPIYSVYEEISSALDRFQYTDGVVNTLHFESEANGYLMMTAGMIAKRQTMGVADIPGDALYDNTPLTVGTNIILTYAGVSVPAKSFSLDINNNFETDDFRLGSFYLGDLTAKRREVTASMSLRHESAAIMRQAVNGTSAGTVAGGLTTKAPLTITCTTYEVIGTSVTPYSVAFTLPNVILTPFAFEPSGDDVLESDVGMQAVRPALGTPVLTAVVKNGQSTVQ